MSFWSFGVEIWSHSSWYRFHAAEMNSPPKIWWKCTHLSSSEQIWRNVVTFFTGGNLILDKLTFVRSHGLKCLNDGFYSYKDVWQRSPFTLNSHFSFSYFTVYLFIWLFIWWWNMSHGCSKQHSFSKTKEDLWK